MNCPKCGKVINDKDTNFCPKCGTSLNGEPPLQKNYDVRFMLIKGIMFAISILCAFAAFIVYLYGHDYFYDEPWITSAPSFKFWEYGNGPYIFKVLVWHTIISFIIGLCCINRKPKQ